MPFVSTDNDEHEDLFGEGQSAGGGATGTGKQWDTDPEGRLSGGRRVGFWGGSPTGAQEDINRYRDMGSRQAGWYTDLGEKWANTQAVTPDYSQFNYGNMMGRDALALQRNAAYGKAPSAAEIAGSAAMDRTLASNLAVAGSTRGGPMQTAAATRDATQNNAAQQAQLQAAIQAGRANEMATARDTYGRTALGYGNLQLGRTGQEQQAGQFAQDLGLRGQLGFEQLGQAGRLGFENLAYGVGGQELGAGFTRSGQQSEATRWNQQNQNEQERLANERFTATTNFARSDVRAKLPVEGGSRATWQVDDAHAEAARKEVGDMMHSSGDISRANPYGTGDREMDAMLDDRASQKAPDATWLDRFIDRAPPNPYGDSQLAYSDAKAKEEAFIAGRQAGIDVGRAEGRAEGMANAQAQAETLKSSPLPPRQMQSFQRDAPPTREQQVASENPFDRFPTPANRSAPMPKYDEAKVQESRWLTPSDPKAKMAYSPAEAKEPVDLGEIETAQIRAELDNAALPEANERAAASTPSRKTFNMQPERKVAQRVAEDKAGREADDLMNQWQGSLASSAAVGPSDPQAEDAARAMEAYPYKYKDEFVPPEQEKGEVNYGPMTQKLETNPLTKTAVKHDPRGLGMLDMTKLVKVQSGVIANLQRQIDDLKYGGARG